MKRDPDTQQKRRRWPKLQDWSGHSNRSGHISINFSKQQLQADFPLPSPTRVVDAAINKRSWVTSFWTSVSTAERQHVMGTMSSPGSGCLCSMNPLDSFHPAPFRIFLNVSVTWNQWEWCNFSLLIPLFLWHQPGNYGWTFGLECPSIMLSSPRVAGQRSRNLFSVEKSRAAMLGNFRSWEPGVLHWSQSWSMSEATSLELGVASQSCCV